MMTDRGQISGVDQFLKQNLFIFYCYLFMYMGVLHAWCPGRPEEDIGSHGMGSYRQL